MPRDNHAMQLLSVQTGTTHRIKIGDRSVLTAGAKQTVVGQTPVLPLGLMGDEQADLSIHGGLEKAVYAYPVEHYAFWQDQRQQAGLGLIDDTLPHGTLSENLTLAGVLETDVWAGDVLRFPRCTLRVSVPREPCYKFNAVMGFSRASKIMAQTGFCGFYLRVETPGSIGAGEVFELIPGPRSASIPQLFAAKRAKHLR